MGVSRGRGTFVSNVDNVDNIIARFYGYGAGKGRGVEKKVSDLKKKFRIDLLIIKNSKYIIISIRGSITHGQGMYY